MRQTNLANPPAQLQRIKIVGTFRRNAGAYVAMIFAAYMAPVLINSTLPFELGGVSTFLLSNSTAVLRYLALWALAAVPFFLGFGSTHGDIRAHIPKGTTQGLWLVVLVLGPVFVALKIALVGQGAYETYAFDAGEMTAGVWTVSATLSEILLYLFALSVLLRKRALCILLFALIGLNLLHGTRIYTVCAISIALFYFIATNPIRLRTALATLALMLTVLIGSLAVFLNRSQVDLNESESGEVLLYAVSPVLYESVFSQSGLIELANGTQIDFRCNPLHFLADTAAFLLPRIISPNKDQMCINYLSYLQPLGALNGVLGTFSYFQWGLGILFFAYGLVGRFLFSQGKSHIIPLSLFIYFAGSTTVRLLRDGPVLSAKFLMMAVVAAVTVCIARRLQQEGILLYLFAATPKN